MTSVAQDASKGKKKKVLTEAAIAAADEFDSLHGGKGLRAAVKKVFREKAAAESAW
jgi:hypothetical protein